MQCSTCLTLFQDQTRFTASVATASDQDPDLHTDGDKITLPKKKKRTPYQHSPAQKALYVKAATGNLLTTDLANLIRDVRHLKSNRVSLQNFLDGDMKPRVLANAQNRTKDLTVTDDQRVLIGARHVPNVWLRDHCQCNDCLHGETKQRLLDTFSIPKDIAIEEHTLDDKVLSIKWSDGHQSMYTTEFLSLRTKDEVHKSVERSGLEEISLWDSSIASDPPVEDYQRTHGPSLEYALRKIRKHGFCYIDQTPFEDPATTENLLKCISFIRETHYGGFYDFTADLASKDTAYTNIALEAHTDTTYFSEPAGLQAFHLLSHTNGEGGASLLVDGFKVAMELYETDKEAYRILSTVNVYAHASGNEGVSIQPYRGFPVLEHDSITGDLLRVRWNSSDRSGIQLPIDKLEAWYDAARNFDSLLKKKENEYWEQLVPGRVLIFDNWRVLHGRSKFTGKRRICGGYINRDDWISKYKWLKYEKAMVL